MLDYKHGYVQGYHVASHIFSLFSFSVGSSRGWRGCPKRILWWNETGARCQWCFVCEISVVGALPVGHRYFLVKSRILPLLNERHSAGVPRTGVG